MTSSTQPFPLPGHVHVIGACGRGMCGLVQVLAKSGVRVTGSDRATYGETRGWLAGHGIAVHDGFDAAHLEPVPDMVVIGRLFGRGNPEIEAVLDRRLPYCSMPEFLSRHFLQRTRNIVVAGTKGKTTTTTMAAWIFGHAGKDPGWFVGGMSDSLDEPMRVTDSGIMILEGDDYTSLWWDDNPKFCFYRPEIAIITNIFPDHPEIHTSDETTKRHFECLVNQLPAGGQLILGDLERSPLLARLADKAFCGVRKTGFGTGDDDIGDFIEGPDGMRFRWRGEWFSLDMNGRMNARNAVAAAMAAEFHGISPAASAAALREFRPVRGRMELLTPGAEIALYADLGYLPECMEQVFVALRARHPGRRLVFLWQPFLVDSLPQSQGLLRTALGMCDLLLFCNPYKPISFTATPMAYVEELAAELAQGRHDVELVGPVAEVPARVPPHLRAGDVVVTLFHPLHVSSCGELARQLMPSAPCASS